MNNEIKKNEHKETKKVHKEINYDLVTTGPLYYSQKYNKPGFHQLFVSNNPGQIEAYSRLGYEIVKDEYEEVTTGDGKPNRSNPFGAAVTVQSKCGQLLVLMEIPDELYDKYEAWKESKQKERSKALGYIDGIPDANQFGGVTESKPR